MYIDYDFYKQKSNVPIIEVAKALGIKNARGKWLCPCHDDHKPSMIITERGRYENKFKCFSCGESGNPLALVMAVNSGVKPSEYFENPSKYAKERNDAALFIEDLFPGAITYTKEAEKEDDFPKIPKRILEEIGLEPNPTQSKLVFPLSSIHTQLTKEEEEYYEQILKPEKFPGLDKIDACNLIAMKISEYIQNLSTWRDELLYKHFPDMPDDGRIYINKTIAEKEEEMRMYIEKLDKYIEKHETEFSIDEYSSDAFSNIIEEEDNEHEL